MSNTLSWGENRAEAELNEHASVVACEHGSGLIIDADYLRLYTDSPEILSIGESFEISGRECIAFPSGPALHLAVSIVPPIEEAFYQLYRKNAENQGREDFYPSSTVMHENFMDSVREQFPNLYNKVQEIYINALLNTPDAQEKSSKFNAEEFNTLYPVAEDLSLKDNQESIDYKEAYESLRIKYNKLREDFIQLSTKYNFLIEQVKLIQAEVKANKLATEKGNQKTKLLEEQLAENKKHTKDIYDELNIIKQYISKRDDTFSQTIRDIFPTEEDTPTVGLTQTSEYNNRLDKIMRTDLSVSKSGIDKFPHQFVGWMKEALLENPNRKDYVIIAARKALKHGYKSQHIQTVIDRFAPEAINQPCGNYAKWVIKTASAPEKGAMR